MDNSYVVKIFVESGNPSGVRRVSKSNWSGECLVFSKNDLSEVLNRLNDQIGVYVLVGDDLEGNFDQQVYVGQSTQLSNRLKEHAKDESKNFWTQTVVFSSVSGEMNNGDIKYLESRLICLARESKRSAISNANMPVEPALSAVDKSEAQGFLKAALDIFSVLGVNAFHPAKKSLIPTAQYFLNGPKASASGENRSDGFLVFEGATARCEETPTLEDSCRNLRADLVKSGILVPAGESYRLTKDYLFTSPSSASGVLLSRSSNGRTEWKDSDGVTLKTHQEEALEPS